MMGGESAARKIMITLFHYPLCPHSRAVRIALAECGVRFTLSEIRPFELTREFLNINPAGTLPVLDVEGRMLCGLFPIVEYQAEASRGGPSGRPQLWPGAPPERAEARRVAEWFFRKFDEEVSQYLLEEKVYKPVSGGKSPPDLELMRTARSNLRYHLSYLSFLSEERKWLGGSNSSFADFAAAAEISVMDYLAEIDWREFPEAKAWYARLKSRPSFRPLLADRLPGFNPPQAYADLDF
jgi:glutathione S-transferase